MNIFEEAFNFISAIGAEGAILLILPFLLFELPRYTLLFFVSSIVGKKREKIIFPDPPDYSVILAGHNEASKLLTVIQSLREQSVAPTEIIVVSDGSSDRMRELLFRLKHEKIIQGAHHVDLRGGKAAALNLATQYAGENFVIQLDCDVTLDFHASRRILEQFQNPKIGIISGNIVPRNDAYSFWTVLQSIEYLISLSLGRQASDLVDQVAISSGAFTAYRKEAIEDCFGLDSGSGEDLDVTLKMRQRGWEARFAHEALCFTDVPTNLNSLIRQRLRWERDAVRLRFDKYFDTINPLDRRFSFKELVHQAEFFLFNIVSAAITPFYFVYVWFWFEEATWVVFFASYLFLILHDFIVFSIAVYMSPRVRFEHHVVFIPLYSLYYILFIRSLRLYAAIDEIITKRSLKTDFLPMKVSNYLKERR